jgi:hypothetical protein
VIPKIVTMYWGGRLSFLRYLTVVSFKKQNPDWHINIFYPAFPNSSISWNTGEQAGVYMGADYFDQLSKLAELIPISMDSIGFSDSMPEVHKSDIVRLWALAEYGGLYSDMDILYFKPLLIPEEVNLILSYDEVNHYFSNGFIGCSIEAKSFYSNLLNIASSISGVEYQSLGPSIFNNHVQRSNYPADVWNIPMSLIYHYNSFHVEDIFIENCNDLATLFSTDSIGCHWYGGHPATRYWENIITKDNYSFNNILSKVINQIL